MKETLVEKIKKADKFLEQPDIDLDPDFKKRLIEYQESCFITHCKEDTLAYDVASGKESYVELIKPIEEKYNSFWKKILVPRTDGTFDNKVRRVIESMNNVGLEYINPEKFTTDRKRRQNKNILLISAGTGLFTAAIPKLIEWSYTANYNNSGNLFVPIIAAGTMYLGNKLFVYAGTNLEYLQESAQKTDKFLTRHYLKLSPT